MDNRELIDIASKGEWTLECDRKVLELMQNLASKIENRSTATKHKINGMVLSLDETKIKMSNLTRINDVKNTVYCENLITDDHLEPISEVPKTTVKLSASIAIENGLKLMENCFEKHRVNLDPSISDSEITTVYRPIDKFYTKLPYLIGERNWKEKWHLGLIEEDKFSQTGSTYAESIDSNKTINSRRASDNLLASESNLMASQTSLSKSNSSIGDQMIINKQGGLFDEVYASEETTPVNTKPSTNAFFAPQPAERKIVNLFDDEPPELTVESSHNRKPVNLFDDVDSVASMPIIESESFDKPLPPVDLFDDNEFDSFIRKMENDQHKAPTEISKKEEVVKRENKINSVQENMKNIATEIKNVNLKKAENVNRVETTTTKTVHITHSDKKLAQQSETIEKEENKAIINPKVIKQQDKLPITPVSEENKPTQPTKSRQKITNLFDDEDDDSEDFFNEIIKQKSQSSESKSLQIKKEETKVHKKLPEKKNSINLFDEEDEDDFDSIFNNKLSTSVNVSTPKTDSNHKEIVNKKEEKSEQISSDMGNVNLKGYLPFNSIFNDVQVASKTPSDNKTETTDKSIVNKRPKKLFDDDDDDDNDDEEEEEKVNDLFKIHSDDKTATNKGQKSNEFIINENKSAQKDDTSAVTKGEDIFTESSVIKSSNENKQTDKTEENLNQFIKKNSIDEDDLLGTSKSDKPIIANCPDDDNANIVSNVLNDSENQNTARMINQNDENLEHEKKKINDETPSESSHISQSNEYSNPVLLLSHEPPDDDQYWDTEENNYEEPDIKEESSRNTSNYLAFNEIPPDDDFLDIDNKNNITEQPQYEEDFDDFLTDNVEIKNDPLPHQSDLSILSEKSLDFESDEDIFKPKITRSKQEPKDENKKSKEEIKNLFDDDVLPETPLKIETKKVDEEITNTNKFVDSLQEPDIEKLNHEKLEKTNEKANNFSSIKEMLENMSISKPDTKSSSSTNQNKNAPKTNIKNKLDIFTSQSEQQSVPQEQSPPKKLPGKLNTNLKINVGALMPGVRIPKKISSDDSNDSFDKASSIEENDSSSSTDKSLPIPEKSSPITKNSSNSNLLNNDITKLRAKIKGKRRPSTRVGRRMIYEKSLNANIDEDEQSEKVDEVSQIDNTSSFTSETKQTHNVTLADIMQSKILSTQKTQRNDLSKINSRDKDLSQNSLVSKSNENILDQKQNNSNILKLFDDEKLSRFDNIGQTQTKTLTNVTTSKSHVFYDDEDETRKMLEEERKKKEASKSKESSLWPFDKKSDDSETSSETATKSKKKEPESAKKSQTNSLFDDDSDGDLFSKDKNKKPKKMDTTKKSETSKSIFYDVDDGDDLFGATKSKKTGKSDNKLFESKADKTIFGDDNDDDDDLFGSKISTLANSPASSKTTPVTMVKKKASTVVNDPLKDLFED